MVLADTISILLVVVGVLAATNTLWLFNKALWPKSVDLAGEIIIESPWKSFFLGLPILICTIFVVGGLSSLGKGPNEFLGLLVLSAYLLFSSLGVSGFATRIGERLGFDKAGSWRSTSYGGIVLELTFLLPLLGWVLIFPTVVVLGTGSTFRALLRKRKKSTNSIEENKDPQSNSSSQLESV